MAFGHYTAAYAFVGLFRMLPDLGMSYASTLAISRERSRAAALISNLLGFQALLSALTLLLCLGIGAVLFEGATWSAVLVLSFDLVLKAVKSTLRFLLKGFELFGTEAVSLLIERGLILLLALAALLLGYGLIGFVLVFAAVRLLETSALLAYVDRRVLPLRLGTDLSQWRGLLLKGLPFAYAGAMILLFFQVDAVMIEQMRGPLEAGWYGPPARVLEGLTLVPRILGYALIPTMAALHVRSPEGVTALYRRGCKYLLLCGLPVAAFGALASEPFLVFLVGDAYAQSASAARLLIPAAAFMFLSNFAETTLACIDRWRTIVVVSTLCVAANVSLNLFFIPRWGYVGAAFTTLVTEAIYCALSVVALHAFGHRFSWASLAWRPLAAALVFGALLAWALPLGLLAASLLASLGFVAATFALGVWDRREWQALRELRVSGAGAAPR